MDSKKQKQKSEQRRRAVEDVRPSHTSPQPMAQETSGSSVSEPEAKVEGPVKETDNPHVGKPMRKLNGAAYKRFKFLVRKGYSKAEARRLAHFKVEEFRVPRGEGVPPQPPKRQRSQEESPREAKKPRCNEGMPSTSSAPATVIKPTRAKARRRKGVTYKGALQYTKMAVMSRRYPTELLTTAQLDMICSSIMDVVEERCDETIKPMFHSSTYKAGYLVLSCKDAGTVEWLKEVVVDLHPWEGAELWATPEADIPQCSALIGYFPNSSHLSVKRILNRIRGQNVGINTSTWRLRKREERGVAAFLVLAIDKTSADAVEARGKVLNYTFGELW